MSSEDRETVGFCGAGKLGLPVAVCMALKHHVLCYDKNPDLMKKRQYENQEKGPTESSDAYSFQEYLDSSDIEFVPLKDLVQRSKIVFVAVQTPHEYEYEGVTRLPKTRKDFDYTHLIAAITDVVKYTHKDQVVAVISTILPGTIREKILPITRGKCRLVYTPSFVAMGSVMLDFLNPEFVLLGGEDEYALDVMDKYYKGFFPLGVPILKMSIESAELVKVTYNTCISSTLNIINTAAQIAHYIPNCNIDHVSNALSKATKRRAPNAYIKAGMPDAGGCHPRDNIALSWLSQKLNLPHNIFDDAMMCRERHMDWFANLLCGYSRKYNLPIWILGKAFKPETNLTAGSCSTLLQNILYERGQPYFMYDPFTDETPLNKFEEEMEGGVYFIATKHSCFKDLKFPVGSIVLDPHRYIEEQENVKIIPIGIGQPR